MRFLRHLPRTLLAFALILAVSGSASAVETALLTVISFNVESDADTNPALVADDIAAIGGDVDLYGLAEVRDRADTQIFAQAAERSGAPFGYMLAKHGNEDRVAILYNLDTLDLQQTFELIRFPGSRKALVGEFVHKASGIEFLFMVNHFNRRDTDRRRRQARLIRDWVLDHDLPAVLTGDHNFDFNPETLRGNRAFEIFTADQRLRWLRPKCLAARTCPPTGTQCDNRYNSIMDFVLIADRARGWRGMAEVLLKRPDYCERERRGYADHYPVRGVIEIR